MAVVAPDWSADALPREERADGVRDALGRSHLPWELSFDDHPVVCALTQHDLAGDTLVECHSGLVSGRRPPGRRLRDDEHVGLLVVLEGREQVRQDDVVVDLGPGDALLWRSGRPASFRVLEPLHKLTLLLPADRLGDVGPGPTALPAGRPGTGLLAGHLRTLSQVARDLPAIDSGFMVDVALDLLRRAARPAAGPVVRASLLDRAVALIEEGLSDPLLAPGAVADRLGVSVRWLHRVFADSGETVSSHIRRRRLERVRRDLANPALRGDTVTSIAFRHGFTDGATLSRQFRAAYGTTPTAYRRQRQA